MPPISKDTLVSVGFLVAAPALLVWVRRDRVHARHAAICGGFAVVLAGIGIVALASMQAGQGMFGVLLGLAAFGSLALALALISAAASIGVALLTRGTSVSDHSVSKYKHVPLTKEHRQWQHDEGRPDATYQEFLKEAHPRRFPTSFVSLFVAALAMILVFFLIRRT